MDQVADIAWLLAKPVSMLFDPASPWNLVLLTLCFVFTLLFVVVARTRRSGAQLKFAAFARFIFDRRVWLHRSSLVDYKLFALNTVLMASVFGIFVLGSEFWQVHAAHGLAALFGPPPASASPGWGVFALTMALQILALDFGYWLAHLTFHRVGFLWEFHKVHHSAQVMTPATEMRQHPVELLFFPPFYGLTSGLTYAVMVQIFGAEAQQLGIQGQTLLLALHLATFHHLRHSHVNMPFTGVWGRLFHSPAHHRIHHSADPRHFDRNLGYLFSIWDWMAGTLIMPRKGERITIGLGQEGATHDSLRAVMWLPVRRTWERVAGR